MLAYAYAEVRVEFIRNFRHYETSEVSGGIRAARHTLEVSGAPAYARHTRGDGGERVYARHTRGIRAAYARMHTRGIRAPALPRALIAP